MKLRHIFVFKILFLIVLSLPALAEKRIAVLPFEVLNKDPNMEQFGIGTMDTITNALGSVPEFVMIDRGQLQAAMKELAFQQSGFTDQDSALKLGKLLNAEILVLGTIQSEGNIYRISTHFTEVESGKIIKSAQVTGTSIFELQDQLVSEIIKQQDLKISETQKDRISTITKATNNVAAYDYYIKGRSEYLLFSLKGFKQSISWFDKALEADNNYTLALASKAEALALLAYKSKLNEKVYNDLLEQAEFNANLAMKQNEKYSEVHRALSNVYYIQEKYQEGADEARKAIAINPNDAEAYYSLWVNSGQSSNDPLIIKTLLLNPYLVIAHDQLGNAYYKEKKFSEAINEYKKTINLNPEYLNAYNQLGNLYLKQGDTDKAVETFKAAISISPDNGRAYNHLAFTFVRLKKFKEARAYFRKACELEIKDGCKWLTNHNNKSNFN